MDKNKNSIKKQASTVKERFQKRLLNNSFEQLLKLHEYFKDKRERKANIQEQNRIKELKNTNLYHHEYNRIKNYLDTSVISPAEVERLEHRTHEVKQIISDNPEFRRKSKYDELLNSA